MDNIIISWKEEIKFCQPHITSLKWIIEGIDSEWLGSPKGLQVIDSPADGLLPNRDGIQALVPKFQMPNLL